MADNVQVSTPAGTVVVATDDVSGVHYQIEKVAFGAADSATQVSAANPLPVVLTGTQAEVEIKNDSGNPVPVNGTVTITDGSGPVTVDGTVAVSGTVTVDSELPAAAALADGAANPTAPAVDARDSIFDGSTWNRRRGVNGLADANAGTGLAGAGGYLYRPKDGTWLRQRAAADDTLLSSGSGASRTSSVIDNPNYRGALFVVRISSYASTDGSLDFRLDGYDPQNNRRYYHNATLITRSGVDPGSQIGVLVYPGIASSANQFDLMSAMAYVPLPLPPRYSITLAAPAAWVSEAYVHHFV